MEMVVYVDGIPRSVRGISDHTTSSDVINRLIKATGKNGVFCLVLAHDGKETILQYSDILDVDFIKAVSYSTRSRLILKDVNCAQPDILNSTGALSRHRIKRSNSYTCSSVRFSSMNEELLILLDLQRQKLALQRTQLSAQNRVLSSSSCDGLPDVGSELDELEARHEQQLKELQRAVDVSQLLSDVEKENGRLTSNLLEMKSGIADHDVRIRDYKDRIKTLLCDLASETESLELFRKKASVDLKLGMGDERQNKSAETPDSLQKQIEVMDQKIVERNKRLQSMTNDVVKENFSRFVKGVKADDHETGYGSLKRSARESPRTNLDSSCKRSAVYV